MRWVVGIVLLAGCGRWSFDTTHDGGRVGDGAGDDAGDAPGDGPLAVKQMTLLAGNYNPAGYADGTGTAAVFSGPDDLASDGTYLYVTDPGNGTIRRVVIATGETTTYAGSAWVRETVDGIGTAARFSSPHGIVLVGTDLFVGDAGAHVVRRIDTTTGMVSTFAGLADTAGNVNATGAAARFDGPGAITTDGTRLFVIDGGNCAVRAIDIATAQVTLVAGSLPGGNVDAQGAAAKFFYPRGIAYEGGQLFVADFWNDAIRSVDPTTGDVTTPATFPVVDGRFAGISATPTMWYVTNGHRLLGFPRPSGSVVTIGGDRWNEGSSDGASTSSRFKAPEGLVLDGTTLYVADSGNSNLRRIDTTTNMTQVVAGRLGLTTGNRDGIGVAARYEEVNDIATDGTYVWVADESAYTIRQIEIATRNSLTVAGTAGSFGTTDAVGAAARLHRPAGLVFHAGLVYFVDEDSNLLRSFDPVTRAVVTRAGSTAGPMDGVGTAAQFRAPNDVATDGTYLYVADAGNATIRRVDPTTWQVTTIAGTALMPGDTDATGAAARFRNPRSLAYCGGALWVADTANSSIRKIDLATNAVVTIAGQYNVEDYIDGPGATARFRVPQGIACDGTQLLVTDPANQTIRAIDLATNVVSTYAGVKGIAYDLDGPLPSARMNFPLAVATFGGRVFLANNYNVRMIE